MAARLLATDKDVTRKVIKAANKVRKKYLTLKLERNEEDDTINTLLKPITQPLNKLAVNSTINHISTVKVEPPTQETAHDPQPGPSFVKDQFIPELKDEEDDVFDDASSLQNIKESMEKSEVYQDFIEQYPKISREYVDKYLRQAEDIDQENGIKYDTEAEKWEIGVLPLDFKQNGDIHVGGRDYKGTRGLYDLLFLNKSKHHTDEDLSNFSEIRFRSSNMKRRRVHSATTEALTTYKPRTRSQTKSLKSSVPTKSGKALLEYNESPKEFVYYNDVNELVDRLRKLDASHHIGNNNNMNEITYILEELARLGVIELDT